MIDRDTWLEIAKASGINFGPAQFSGVLEAEISEFDLEAYTKAVAQKAAEAEREACAQAAEGFPENRSWVPGSLWGNIRRDVASAIRNRGIGGGQ